MVSKEIVMGTVKRMADAGIDKETIKSTLRDIGLTDSEISAYLQDAGLEAPATPAAQASPESTPEQSPLSEPAEPKTSEPESVSDEDFGGSLDGEDLLEEHHEKIAQKTADKLAGQIELIKNEQGMKEAANRLVMEEHKQKLSEIGTKIASVNASMPKQEHVGELSVRIKALEELIFELQNDLSEVKASTGALQSLLKKILETDRQILLNTSKK